MKAYKLVRLTKDGNIAPLFINKKEEFKIGEWMESKCYPTKGFAVRQGFHCCFTPYAPHLKEELKNGEKRVWVEVEVDDFEKYDRPESQGGAWVLADKMFIVRIMEDEVKKIEEDRQGVLLDECLTYIQEVVNDDTELVAVLGRLGFTHAEMVWYGIKLDDE